MPRSSPSGRRPVGDHGLGREQLAEVDERGWAPVRVVTSLKNQKPLAAALSKSKVDFDEFG